MVDYVTIRASSLSDLFDCPARWEAKHLLNKRLPTSDAARLGTAVHAGTAAYDQAVLDGAPISADDAAGAVVDKIWDNTDDDVVWDDLNQSEAEKIGLALHKMYCKEIAPRQEYIGVEVTCERLVLEDLGIALTGTTDRIRRTAYGFYGIADLKTGKTAVAADGTVKTAGHAGQLGVYSLLASHAIGQPLDAPAQIIGLTTAKTDKGRRVGIGEVEGATDLLVGDDDNPGLLQMASKLIHNGDFYGNQRSALCSVKYCPAYNTCKWRR